MSRVTISPRRDLGKPLVEVDDAASPLTKAVIWLFRSYLVFVVAIGLLAVVAGIVFLITL
jgi:hypothetical protein